MVVKTLEHLCPAPLARHPATCSSRADRSATCGIQYQFNLIFMEKK